MKRRMILTSLALSSGFLCSILCATAKGESIQSKNDLTGKTIVVTGASSGFGRGVSLNLAKRGANLVLASRRLDVLKTLATECGASAIAVQVDVSSPDDMKRLTKTALARFAHIDAWINDAGVGAIGRFTDIPMEDENRIVQTNLNGVINGSHCALEQFQKQHFGTLINVASTVGEIPLGYYAVYSASKLGVVGLDKALRAELKAEHESQIHVCTVLPISTDTPFWQHAANYTGQKLRPPYLGQPEAVVNAIANLVLQPKKNVRIGRYAKTGAILHRLMPETVETLAAKKIRKDQFSGGSPAAITDGAILQSIGGESDVHGGLKESYAAKEVR